MYGVIYWEKGQYEKAAPKIVAKADNTVMIFIDILAADALADALEAAFNVEARTVNLESAME